MLYLWLHLLSFSLLLQMLLCPFVQVTINMQPQRRMVKVLIYSILDTATNTPYQKLERLGGGGGLHSRVFVDQLEPF